MRTGSCTKITKYRLGFVFFFCFFIWALPWEPCTGISASVGHKAFQVTPVPGAPQSMSALLVCAVMAHLEYNRHSCPDKALLVCLCALVHCFLFFFFFFFTPSLFLPIALRKDFFSPPSFLHLSVVCPIDLFVSAPVMVPSFGSFVNTLDVIAILCETKKRGGIKMSSGLLNCFDEVIAERVLLCVCVCECVRVCVYQIDW